jgi:phenylpropionate dioxygenase-like ring-hydroxylating dioxygenase large terminal subunit
VIPHDQTNRGTQPRPAWRVFLRADVLPRGWYFVAPAASICAGQKVAVYVGRQRLVVFRGEDGAVGAVDGWCPHMGLDLAMGEVRGDHLRCAFHHWRIGRDGRCARRADDTPLHTRSWATTERYGAIWVYPDADADVPLLEIPGLEGKEVIARLDEVNHLSSPYHLSMINGLDVAHLAAVHDVGIQMTAELHETARQFDAVVTGEIPASGLVGRALRTLLGPRYSYAMRYADATVAGLQLMREVRLGSWRWPSLTMIFAYRPNPDGTSISQPIFVAERRPGALGRLQAEVVLAMTRIAYRALEAEDQAIYDGLRFDDTNLGPTDAPVKAYVAWVERLEPSAWSTAR